MPPPEPPTTKPLSMAGHDHLSLRGFTEQCSLPFQWWKVNKPLQHRSALAYDPSIIDHHILDKIYSKEKSQPNAMNKMLHVQGMLTLIATSDETTRSCQSYHQPSSKWNGVMWQVVLALISDFARKIKSRSLRFFLFHLGSLDAILSMKGFTLT
jgi:hypothetical protein